eukprot:GHRR01028357.1.p1 GENE.GHRR01028357.1~~GHRR01028357.1.p1  ORF type:complete len:136 (+),score=39.70 GHRR01028357.1:304-711(+)
MFACNAQLQSVLAGCQNTKLTPLLDGAPNFRQVDGLPVYGVAIPTVRGLRNVLDVLGAAHGAYTLLAAWHEALALQHGAYSTHNGDSGFGLPVLVGDYRPAKQSALLSVSGCGDANLHVNLSLAGHATALQWCVA